MKYLQLFNASALASLCAACGNSSDQTTNLSGPTYERERDGVHSFVFTPYSDIDSNGSSCWPLVGEGSMYGDPDGKGSNQFSMYVLPFNNDHENQTVNLSDNLPDIYLGSLAPQPWPAGTVVTNIWGLLNRNGTIESATSYNTLGNWGAAVEIEVDANTFEDLINQANDLNDPNTTIGTGFRGNAEELAALISTQTSTSSIMEPFIMTGNFFNGGEWSGPISNQGEKCAGIWEIDTVPISSDAPDSE